MEAILISLSGISSSTLNYFFIVLMLFLGFLSFLSIRNEERKSLFINSIPVLGMLGTFLGISIGLYKFDVTQINNSIPILLSGMKVAFITSVCGILFSLIFKFLHQILIRKTEKSDTELDAINKIVEKLEKTNELISIKNEEDRKSFEFLEKLNILEGLDSKLKKLDNLDKLSTLENLDNQLNTLDNILESLKDLNILSEINEKLDNLKILEEKSINIIEELKTLGNINDKLEKLSLLSEVNNKLLLLKEIEEKIILQTGIIKENGELLVTEFRSFAKQMAENNSKAFIEALNNSMKDLNNNLTEQFGENFKELNKAVYKLVEWQERYKETVEKTTENQKVIYDNLEKAKDGITEFATEGENVINISKEFKSILEEINTQKLELLTILGTFAELNTQSKELLPNLKEVQNNLSYSIDNFDRQLTEVVVNLSETSNKNSEVLNETSTSLNNFIETFKNNSEDLLEVFNKNTSDLLEAQNKASMEIIEDIGEKIKLVSEELSSESLKVSEELSNNLIENIEETNKLTNEAIKENTDQIRELLASSLQQSLNTLADQNYEVLEHFVENFENMVDSLKKANESFKR